VSESPDAPWIERQAVALERIADALERLSPAPQTIPAQKPADLDALTVVTDRMRRKWQDEEDRVKSR
jgi:hypothetical protein